MRKTTEKPGRPKTPRSKPLRRTPSKQAGKPDEREAANPALRKDPKASHEEPEDRALWETSVTDGWSIFP
jgi:hypothetical protein